VLRTLLTHTPVKRLVRGVPVMRLLAAGEVALLAKEHLELLDGEQRHRLIELVRKARGRPSSLSEHDRSELGELLALLEPRRLAGDAAEKVSPVPLPKRLLYGRDRRDKSVAQARRSDE
jgi:hypothetical protein